LLVGLADFVRRGQASLILEEGCASTQSPGEDGGAGCLRICQLGAEAGVSEHNIFGRDEPALHHYHDTYRETLGMEPLELIPA
jgi:hypothetical protein